MTGSTKDKAKGKFHELRGKLKAKVGAATKNRRLQVEGIGESIAGKIQEKFGRVEKAIEQKVGRHGSAQTSRAKSQA